MSDVLTCYYDLHVSPPTYEMASFLCRCEQERLQNGYDNVAVIVVPGPVGGFRRDHLWPPSIEERRSMLDKVAVPLCALLPSSVGVVVETQRPLLKEPSLGYGRHMYGLDEFVRAYRAGIRPLRAQGPITRDPKLVTITLREAEHWPERNSRIGQWVEAAAAIETLGFRVVFVRDTMRAGDRIGGFEISQGAAQNIADRARLYASAAVNFGVGNGPMWMALAMDAPVLMLRPVDNSLGRCFGDWHFRDAGVDPGGQIPGAPDYQRLVWEDDNRDNIMKAFDAFMSTQETAAVA